VSLAQTTDVEAFAHVGSDAVRFDDEVGLGDKRCDVRIRRRSDHGLLARIEEGEERGVATSEVAAGRRPATQRIACRGSTLMTSAPASTKSFEQ